MESAKLNDWMQVVGIFAVVASLVFVGFQIRQDREIAATQAWNDATTALTDQNQYIDDNKEIWIRGLDGAELSLSDEYTFQAMNRAVFLRKLAQWQRNTKLTAGNPARVVQGYAYNIYVYPGLRRFFDENIVALDERRSAFGSARGTASFTAVVEASLAELERNPPPPPSKKSYYIY